jgi:hypothetical protein
MAFWLDCLVAVLPGLQECGAISINYRLPLYYGKEDKAKQFGVQGAIAPKHVGVIPD